MRDTVAGRNAVNSPVDMVVHPSFHIGFQKEQVVQDFFHQQYVRIFLEAHLSLQHVF